MIQVADIKIAYLLGIGGIGMSAIARYFKELGIEVHGYDKTRNELLIQLEKEGFIIHYDQNVEAIPHGVLNTKHGIVMYTPAIPLDHKELRFFYAKRIPVYKRSEVLGFISKDAYTIAVSGTHGKTTTSCMIAHMLEVSGINFTAFLGGISSNFNSNYVHKTNGKNLSAKPLMVLEADEFDRSFLKLHPDIAIVTSTDADHLDIYGQHDEVKRSFNEFIHQIKENGKAIIHEQVNLKADVETIYYGSETGEAKYSQVEVRYGKFEFNYSYSNQDMRIQNALPGFHNVENATAALCACMILGLPLDELKKACLSFKGVKRRFEYVVKNDKYIVIDDYAHHPTELTACIKSVKELYPNKKLTGLFQPHLYSRTRDFADAFANALDLLDICWLLEIYPAREEPIEGINSEFLALKMKHNPLILAREGVVKHLLSDKPELLLILGAGDIDQLIKPIKIAYEEIV